MVWGSGHVTWLVTSTYFASFFLVFLVFPFFPLTLTLTLNGG